jgi:chromosome segregation ATPase
MSNDLIKAAEEARKFVRSMQSLCAVADMLEDAGSIEQAKNETLNAVEKSRKELAELKAECSAMKEAAEKTLADAKAEAKEIVKNAIVERNQINAEVRSRDDSLNAVIAKMQKECGVHHKQIEQLQKENEKLHSECSALKDQLAAGADVVKKAKAAVAALA